MEQTKEAQIAQAALLAARARGIVTLAVSKSKVQSAATAVALDKLKKTQIPLAVKGTQKALRTVQEKDIPGNLIRKYTGLFGKGNISNGLYGPEIAARGRRHGTIMLTDDALGHSDEISPLLSKIIHTMGAKTPRTVSNVRDIPKDFKGVLVNTSSKAMPGDRAYKVIGSPSTFENKLREGKMLHRMGVGPRTESIQHIVNKYNLNPRSHDYNDKLRLALTKEFGPEKGRYIMKEIYGAASDAVPTDKSKLLQVLRSRTGDARSGGTLVQERELMTPVSRLEKWLHRPGGLWEGFSHAGKGGSEYRVHVVNGKVVPGASLGRGSAMRNAISIPTTNIRKAERFSQAVVDKLPHSQQRGTFGFDVGINTKGKPFIIELNPAAKARARKSLTGTSPGGASGYVERSDVADAVIAGVEGRAAFPKAMAQAGGTAVAGTAAMANGIHRFKEAEVVKYIPMQVLDSDNNIKGDFKAEVADTPDARKEGLSKRANLAPNTGMFFDTGGPFWMKDVNFPLDLVQVTKEGSIREIHTMPTIPSGIPDRLMKNYWSMDPKVAYAVELPGGWCKEHKVAPGDTIRLTR